MRLISIGRSLAPMVIYSKGFGMISSLRLLFSERGMHSCRFCPPASLTEQIKNFLAGHQKGLLNDQYCNSRFDASIPLNSAICFALCLSAFMAIK